MMRASSLRFLSEPKYLVVGRSHSRCQQATMRLHAWRVAYSVKAVARDHSLNSNLQSHMQREHDGCRNAPENMHCKMICKLPSQNNCINRKLSFEGDTRVHLCTKLPKPGTLLA